MRGGGRNDGVGLAELAVDLFEAFQESGQCRGADGDVPSHRDIAVAQCAGDDLDLFFCGRVLDPEQIVGQRLAEAAVDVCDCVGSDAAAFRPPQSIQRWTSICALASSWRSRFLASLL